MFKLMRVSKHERLMREQRNEVHKAAYALGLQLGRVKNYGMDGTDLAMKQIEATVQAKTAEDWHQQNDDRESEHD